MFIRGHTPRSKTESRLSAPHAKRASISLHLSRTGRLCVVPLTCAAQAGFAFCLDFSRDWCDPASVITSLSRLFRHRSSPIASAASEGGVP